ncbi:Eco57I restriction-modification methylase domain-containing protein [Pseudomonas sp. PDM13]|uniref:Eco57I restriction-modification methylase domain-containing protein n=1 Tax=Pseudomonas sp. PDM13 TaxID=2769255 RepID=UPI0021E05C2F|nr:N-6 DNA methylase [Pseudomonas sp. PDM13]MCU9947097.1 N-6 DNA methylase [Pseudomonas sp. PDM13]
MSDSFLQLVENSRVVARDHIDGQKRKLEEQYFTPARIAALMSEMFTFDLLESYEVLDPCCGVGNLAAALYERCIREREDSSYSLVERDAYLYECARRNFEQVEKVHLYCLDFFEMLDRDRVFDRIIINPPYSKISADSSIRKKCLSFLGYSDSNLYTSFLACCLKLLSAKGEVVAIIPRSFCNGPMFKGFRNFLFDGYFIHQIHLFESRKIFSDSGVTQEVLIIKISRVQVDTVLVRHEKSNGEISNVLTSLDRIVFAADAQKFIHIPLAHGDDELLLKIGQFRNNLSSLGLRASTGKVVDFRSEDVLRKRKSKHTVELIYQDNLSLFSGVSFSIKDFRLRFIKRCPASEKNLVPRANYILVRRISFKESALRIVAAPLLSHELPSDYLGVENHLNYIWGEKCELRDDLCLGLYGYISTLTVDRFIRRFSGHTQINAADLESLPMPDSQQLEKFGSSVRGLPYDAISLQAERYFFDS